VKQNISGTQKISVLRISRTEFERLGYLHQCVAEALVKTGEVVITEALEAAMVMRR
jgi:hypothetical protein